MCLQNPRGTTFMVQTEDMETRGRANLLNSWDY